MIVTLLENLALLAGLLLLTVLCNRSRRGGWMVIIGIALAMTVSCIAVDAQLQPFTWIKAYTLFFSAAWIHVTRFHSLLGQRVAFVGTWIFLALNIVEAAVQDLILGHILNGLCGLILVTSLASYRNIAIKGEDKHLSWPIPLSWVLAYTMWNFAFVSGSFGWHLSDHFIVLGIPLCYVLLRRDVWVQVRAYSLTLYVGILIMWIDAFQLHWPNNVLGSQVDEFSPPDDGPRIILTAVACVFVLAHLASRLRDGRAEQKKGIR